MEDSLLQDVMAQLLEKHSDWKQRHGQTLALAALIKHAAAASRWAAAPAVATLAPQVSVFALLYQESK